MGQLIKLEDYISRYQRDVFHYPGQYIRLKQENWKKMIQMWEKRISEPEEEDTEEPEQKFPFINFKQFFNRRKEIDVEEAETSQLPKTKEELKQQFLDMLFPFQLNWASSTISEMSFLDKSYQENLTLKYFMQRFPDTFLFMYHPIFQLKNASVDADIIMITPVSIEIIQLLERPSDQHFIAEDGRTWFVEENNVRKKIISPMISIRRTEKIVKSILAVNSLNIPVNNVVLSRTNHIQFYLEPYQTSFVGKDQHEQWLQGKRNFVSPLKHNQLKVAEALLSFSDTVAVNRPEWNQQDQEEF